MLQSALASPPPHQQQQQAQPTPHPLTSTSNDRIFWSPTPPHSIQPTSILQRPPQPPQPPQQQQFQSTFMNAPGTMNLVPGGGAEFAGDYSQIYEWVSQLLKGPEGREKALLELSKKREQYDDLALILWHSFGTCLSLSIRVVLTSDRSYVNLTAGDH
jgi:hypothetical protein